MTKKNSYENGKNHSNIAASVNETLFDNLNEWLTTSEAADYLKVSKGSLLNMVWRKQIRPHKLGRRNRYLKSDLSELIINSCQTLPKKEV